MEDTFGGTLPGERIFLPIANNPLHTASHLSSFLPAAITNSSPVSLPSSFSTILPYSEPTISSSLAVNHAGDVRQDPQDMNEHKSVSPDTSTGQPVQFVRKSSLKAATPPASDVNAQHGNGSPSQHIRWASPLSQTKTIPARQEPSMPTKSPSPPSSTPSSQIPSLEHDLSRSYFAFTNNPFAPYNNSPGLQNATSIKPAIIPSTQHSSSTHPGPAIVAFTPSKKVNIHPSWALIAHANLGPLIQARAKAQGFSSPTVLASINPGDSNAEVVKQLEQLNVVDGAGWGLPETTNPVVAGTALPPKAALAPGLVEAIEIGDPHNPDELGPTQLYRTYLESISEESSAPGGSISPAITPVSLPRAFIGVSLVPDYDQATSEVPDTDDETEEVDTPRKDQETRTGKRKASSSKGHPGAVEQSKNKVAKKNSDGGVHVAARNSPEKTPSTTGAGTSARTRHYSSDSESHTASSSRSRGAGEAEGSTASTPLNASYHGNKRKALGRIHGAAPSKRPKYPLTKIMVIRWVGELERLWYIYEQGKATNQSVTEVLTALENIDAQKDSPVLTSDLAVETKLGKVLRKYGHRTGFGEEVRSMTLQILDFWAGKWFGKRFLPVEERTGGEGQGQVGQAPDSEVDMM